MARFIGACGKPQAGTSAPGGHLAPRVSRPIRPAKRPPRANIGSRFPPITRPERRPRNYRHHDEHDGRERASVAGAPTRRHVGHQIAVRGPSPGINSQVLYPSVMIEDALPNPPLPFSLEGVRACGRFIKGVAATKEDAASRKAVFSSAPHGTPLDSCQMLV
jgi:hypothetical protein